MAQEIDSPGSVDRNASWQALVNRIADGDEEAFGEFYEQTKAPVYGLILRIVSLTAVAEEVTMDAYVQIWRQAFQFRQSRGTVYTWLMLLARSRALDRLRRERRRPNWDWETFTDGLDVVDLGHSQETLVQVKQAKSKVSEVLNKLPEEQKQVIQLSFYEGMSHAEIAEQLQLPLGTVKTRIRTAIGRFRQVLA